MRISEGKALALVFVGYGVSFLGSCAALNAIGAADNVIAFMALVFLVVGTQVLGAVLHHYAPMRRKREK